jgi:hypothetical protein
MVAVTGEQAWTLGQQAAARMACEGKRTLVLCGDNRFNSYAIARIAKAREKRPEEVLRRILVARAFTAHQLDELIHRLRADDDYALVIISGICTAFLDEDVASNEAARLYYRSLWRLASLAREGLTLLLTENASSKQTPRAHFLTDLCRASNVVIRVEGEHGFTLERRKHNGHLARWQPTQPTF